LNPIAELLRRFPVVRVQTVHITIIINLSLKQSFKILHLDNSSKLELAFFSKSTTNGTPLPFLLELYEYKVVPAVLDDPPPDAKDVLTLN
jgi:hypothetical protein